MRVLAMMSGGVDSSVAAALLVERGWEVVGATMKLSPHHNPTDGRCCTVRDAGDARRVAAALGIPHYTFDLTAEFARDVIDPFRQSYMAGETPIPCLPCNHVLKFGVMLDRAWALGCERVATGHYIQLAQTSDGPVVRRARDLRKDQSYFLCRVPRQAFAQCEFPLGDLSKDQVRSHARALGLWTADKAESQEICFVGEGTYRDFLRRPATPGPITDRTGNVLGRHEGYWNYTIGQRRGLGVASGVPLYVIDILPHENRVVVGERSALFSLEVSGRALNLLYPLTVGTRVSAKLRHQHDAALATVVEQDETHIRLRFDMPQLAVTPGQALALYQDDRLIAGAEICRFEHGIE